MISPRRNIRICCWAQNKSNQPPGTALSRPVPSSLFCSIWLTISLLLLMRERERAEKNQPKRFIRQHQARRGIISHELRFPPTSVLLLLTSSKGSMSQIKPLLCETIWRSSLPEATVSYRKIPIRFRSIRLFLLKNKVLWFPSSLPPSLLLLLAEKMLNETWGMTRELMDGRWSNILLLKEDQLDKWIRTKKKKKKEKDPAFRRKMSKWRR